MRSTQLQQNYSKPAVKRSSISCADCFNSLYMLSIAVKMNVNCCINTRPVRLLCYATLAPYWQCASLIEYFRNDAE